MGWTRGACRGIWLWPIAAAVSLIAASAGATEERLPTSAEIAAASATIGRTAADLKDIGSEAAQARATLTQLAQAAPRSDPAINSATAQLAIRLNQLELDLRTATGRIEELSHQVRQLDERLSKFMADVDYRLNEQGKPAGTAAAQPGGAVPEPPPPGAAGGPRVLGPSPVPTGAAPPSLAGTEAPAGAAAGTAREDYARAFGLLQKGNYAEAETAFKTFLQQHSDDPLTENARYWLGETFYARGDYQRAAETFLDGYEKNKNGGKAPDTLLKLGMSLAGLGKSKEACASFRELERAFPEASPAVKDRAKQEQQKLKCS